ncbi:cartilage intermediate layer protein 1-like [Narcine bancroftii]|uniref:cartilage intermediate layer protein 1-like n=1 Tax=Narcine bancroftii TaxID=1343680 RepID=UPI00383137F0
MDRNLANAFVLFGLVCGSSQGHWLWTPWFNIDHPGGNGDYERLDAIRHYYPDKLCPTPVGVEARTTQGVPATFTGERVHLSHQHGFWCVNTEQPSGKHCSNYAVRFQCPKGSISGGASSSWSQWSEWGPCTADCEQTGVQTRSRTCSSARREDWQLHCPGPLQEGRMCEGQLCTVTPSTALRLLNVPEKISEEHQTTECDLHCVLGRVNAECTHCMCEEHVLYGSVRLQDGSPASGTFVHLQGDLDTPLTNCDHNGKFRIPGLCPDGTTALQVTKPYYGTAVVTLEKSTSKTSYIDIKLRRSEKPFIRKQPQSKARREGQDVSFCCQVVCNPPAHQYLWYHNGSLLDRGRAGFGRVLVLSQLQKQQAGKYMCQASNSVGSIKSQPATLTITAWDAPSCNPRPQNYQIKLPFDCYQNLSQSLYYDVGRCPTTACAGSQQPEGLCKDTTAHCCGPVKFEDRIISCPTYTLPIRVVTRCGCQRCIDTKAIVRGRAVAVDNGEPMRFGQIFMGRKKISMTGYKGTFSIVVPADISRLVLTFVDRHQKFVNTTKVLPFNRKGGSVFHEIKLVRKRPELTLDCSISNTINLGTIKNQNPIAELELLPNTFYRPSGELYRGLVKASVTFLDPRDISLASAAQSDLNFISEDGDILPLRTYGMFSLDFTDEAAQESLSAGRVRVFLDSAQVNMPEHLEQMKLWSLNPETGFWEEEGVFTFISRHRGKREERTFLVGNMEIRERRLFNLDVPENRRCYLKVRSFRSDRLTSGDQLEGVTISLINLEPMPGFVSNPRAWGRFDSKITGSNGACVPVFCDDKQADAYSAYVMATLRGEELEAVSSSASSNVIGVQQPYLSKLQYRRSDHKDPRAKKTVFRINVAKPNDNLPEEINGPIYPYEKLRECEEAPFSAGHFQFYRVESDRYDYNTVPFTEDDPLSWTEDYLAWWPRPLVFRACYIKLKLRGNQEITVRSRNLGGTHPATVGQMYGLRDVRSIHDANLPGVSAVCLEFKCSGMLYDQERVDRTLVKVIPQGHCHVENVNSMLQEYLVNHLPLAVNNDTSEFTMLAPLDPLGHNYGIYTVTDQDPSTAKEIALGRCFAGSSDAVSRVMNSNVGVALTFNCEEKPASHRSVFQSLQEFPGQRPAYNPRMGRGKRGRAQGVKRRGLRLFSKLRRH